MKIVGCSKLNYSRRARFVRRGGGGYGKRRGYGSGRKKSSVGEPLETEDPGILVDPARRERVSRERIRI